MFCNNCHADLSVFGAAVELMLKCPMCGQELKKPEKEVPQLSFESFCTKLIKEANEDIFASDEAMLQKVFELASPEYVNARDKMSMLAIKCVPSLIYNAAKFPEAEQVEILNKCQKLLCFDLGVAFDPCKEMLDVLQKNLWKKALPVNQYFVGDAFKDPRDGQVYKTVKIGDQVWMAENLRYKCVGEKNGLYTRVAVNKYCAVKGWRIPSQTDFKKLIDYAKNAGYGDASSVLMAKDGWKNCNVTSTDNLGFAAYPFKDSTIINFWDNGAFDGGRQEYMALMPGRIDFNRTSEDVVCAVRLIKDDQPIDSQNKK